MKQPDKGRALSRAQRKRRGASLVEAIVGFVVIIPIGLAAVDLATIVSISQQNEQVAEECARAAATQRSEKGAQKAADEVVESVQLNTIIAGCTVDPVNFDAAAGQVTVYTNMKVNMPIPMPLFSQYDIHAHAMQPIVAFPASQ